MIVFGFLLIAAAAAQSPSFASDLVQRRQRLQAKLDALHAAGQFPGATAGFVLADGSPFGLATGFSDKTKKIRMTPADLMLQGSVGKTYVAATALQLVHEGKINLDDKIEKYLGNESWFARLPNARDITVRMLMNHTSGLMRYEFREQFTAANARRRSRQARPEYKVRTWCHHPPNAVWHELRPQWFLSWLSHRDDVLSRCENGHCRASEHQRPARHRQAADAVYL